MPGLEPHDPQGKQRHRRRDARQKADHAKGIAERARRHVQLLVAQGEALAFVTRLAAHLAAKALLLVLRREAILDREPLARDEMLGGAELIIVLGDHHDRVLACGQLDLEATARVGDLLGFFTDEHPRAGDRVHRAALEDPAAQDCLCRWLLGPRWLSGDERERGERAAGEPDLHSAETT